MKNNSEHIAANEQKWSRRAKTFDNKRFDYFRYFQRKVISQTKLKKGACLLDMGCGTGWAVRYASSILDGDGEFVGIDISSEMIERAKENSAGLANLQFIIANSEDMPLESDHFNAVICTNSFHHYLNPQKALSEVLRVLKKGGRIYILDIASDDFFTNFIDIRVREKEKEHVRFYGTRQFKALFSEAGLKHIESKVFLYPLKLQIAEKE